MCGWVPSPVPHTCLTLSLHMTNAAPPSLPTPTHGRRSPMPLSARGAMPCRAHPSPGYAHAAAPIDVRGRGPCIASGTGLLWRWADSPSGRRPCAGIGLTAPTSAPGLGSPLPHLRRDWADSPSGRRVCAPARARARWRRTRLRARRRWERALDLLTAHNMHSITGRVLHHNLTRSLQH